MKPPIRKSKSLAVVFLMAAVIVVATGLFEFGRSRGRVTNANAAQGTRASAGAAAAQTTLDLSASQLNAVKIDPAGTYFFPVQKEAVGNISFADDLSVQVYPSYQGKIIKSLVQLGEEVRKGQVLYTIDSPDLIQAESTLIEVWMRSEIGRAHV